MLSHCSVCVCVCVCMCVTKLNVLALTCNALLASESLLLWNTKKPASCWRNVSKLNLHAADTVDELLKLVTAI